MEKKLLRDLKKKFPKKKFSLALVETTAEIQKETLIVNGKKIKYSWSPPIGELKEKEKVAYKRLLKWCVKGVKNIEWKEEVKSGKK
tara:strand:+ start:174 stop:431 length:258 start_codon:yes stop_codon:yes gene_type:complete